MRAKKNSFNFATKKQGCLHCERPGSQLVRESRQKFPSLLEKLFFFLAYFDIVPRPLAPRNESGGRPLFLCRAVGAGRGVGHCTGGKSEISYLPNSENKEIIEQISKSGSLYQ